MSPKDKKKNKKKQELWWRKIKNFIKIYMQTEEEPITFGKKIKYGGFLFNWNRIPMYHAPV